MSSRRIEIDWLFVLASVGLALVGLLALTSAGGPHAERQTIWLGVGVFAMVAFAAVGYRTWGEHAPILYALNVVALLAVLAIGTQVNSARSWLSWGPINVQPSEFMKICTILVLARALARTERDELGFPELIKVAIVVGIPLLLVALQPDLGTALAFAVVLGVGLVLVGLRRRTWAVLIAAGLVVTAVGWTKVLKDYQRERIRTFLHPETDPRAMGYQILQSRIAVGSGGLSGKGWADGTQSQLNFIPEKHTDFVFPILAEEWGFLGSIVVIGLYALLLSRGLRIAMEARDAFGAYLVAGIMTLIATHVMINLGMVLGLLPTIGIPLPLLSYGGSSVVSTLAGLGLILNVQMRRSTGG